MRRVLGRKKDIAHFARDNLSAFVGFRASGVVLRRISGLYSQGPRVNTLVVTWRLLIGRPKGGIMITGGPECR